MQGIFERVKSQVSIAQVVEHFGVKLNRNDKGVCPFHEEKTASFSVKRDAGIYTCFGCGATGDAIDFVAKLKNIEPLDATRLIAEIFRIETNDQRPIAKTKHKTTKKNSNITEYLKICIGNIGMTDYFHKRGLTDSTIKRFRLGYDKERDAVVIPYSSKLEYYQSRSTKKKEFFKPRREDAGEEPLYNLEALNSKDSEPIFIVESAICAISIAQCGYKAVALNGTMGAKKLVETLKGKKPNGTIVLCLDNDQPGFEASSKLADELKSLKIKCIKFNIAGQCKDPNECLMKYPKEIEMFLKDARRRSFEAFVKHQSIKASDLQKKDIPPIEWLVEGMVTPGLSILCAPSKGGKSWMALQLCCAISSGQPFMQKDTKRAYCQYYALEDRERRIQDRMNKVLEFKAAPDNLEFFWSSERLDTGLVEQLEEQLKINPEIRFMILDVFQIIRGSQLKGESAYGYDYRETRILKDFADKHNVAVLLIHHLRKASDDKDPFNRISGTNGIMAVCDNIFILEKGKREDDTSILHMTGRDIEQDDWEISWNQSVHKWERVGTAEDKRRREAREKYEATPLVKIAKKMVELCPSGWRGTPSDLACLYRDYIDKDAPPLAQDLGRQANSKTLQDSMLYNDNIICKAGHSGSKKYIKFIKRRPGMPSYQYMMNDIMDDGTENEE